jgi:protein O-GlcNAc transferase
MTSQTIQQAIEQAVAHHQAGRLADAEGIYRQILTRQPNQAAVLNMLGILVYQRGRPEAAAELIGRAIAAEPNVADYHNNRGVMLSELGQLVAAAACFHAAIQLKPDFAQAFANLGNALMKAGKLDDATAAFRRAVELRPDLAEAHYNLGNALKAAGRPLHAVTCYERALAIHPDFPQAHNNLGSALADLGRLDEAISSLRLAAELKPGDPAIWGDLAEAHRRAKRLDEAEGFCQRALTLKPDYIRVHINWGNVLRDGGRPDEAIERYRRALDLNPISVEAATNLGNALRDSGRLDEAISTYRKAAESSNASALIHSNWVYTLYFHPGFDAAAIFREHQHWNHLYADPLKTAIYSHDKSSERAQPERKLRVGYVSPNFHAQAEAFFVVPLLESHDRRQFEIYCFDTGRLSDAVTDRIRAAADVWRPTNGWSDEKIARQIFDDRIDLLIDLTMHIGENNLLAFARKPAPIQICWLAYPGTTGLPTMDYRLTDSLIDPPELPTPCYSEESLRLPDCWCCFDPLKTQAEVCDLPMLTGNGPTLGSLNNFVKINNGVLELWSRVMHSVPNSQLLLLAPRGSTRRRVAETLNSFGIGPDRVRFVDAQPRADYLKTYHQIDVCLDPLPYNGITTTCDALWMGVPVISLSGRTAAGRAGFSVLTAAGFPQWAAKTPDEFVRIATDLCADPSELAKIRRSLRTRIQDSPLMDAKRFARNVESAYRQVWRKWCGAPSDGGVQS